MITWPTDSGVSEVGPIYGHSPFAGLRTASDQVRFTSSSSSFTQVNAVARCRKMRVKNFTPPGPLHPADARDRDAHRTGELLFAPGSRALVRRFAIGVRFAVCLRSTADEIDQ